MIPPYSAARTLELVGERGSLLILRDAMFRGFTRFCENRRGLDMAPNILAKRLGGFVASGVMEARQHGAPPEHRDTISPRRPDAGAAAAQPTGRHITLPLASRKSGARLPRSSTSDLP